MLRPVAAPPRTISILGRTSNPDPSYGTTPPVVAPVRGPRSQPFVRYCDCESNRLKSNNFIKLLNFHISANYVRFSYLCRGGSALVAQAPVAELVQPDPFIDFSDPNNFQTAIDNIISKQNPLPLYADLKKIGQGYNET